MPISSTIAKSICLSSPLRYEGIVIFFELSNTQRASAKSNLCFSRLASRFFSSQTITSLIVATIRLRGKGYSEME